MIYSAAANNHFSPPEMRVISGVKSDIPLVLVTVLDNYQFNPELLNLKEYCLIDFCEYEWDKSDFTDTHIFGKNTNDFAYRFKGGEWEKFDKWVAANSPKIYFKRELLKKDATDWLQPIEYPFYGQIPEIQTKEEYDARLINVFHYFGRSHEARIKAHADFWLSGAAICDSIYQFNDFITKEESKNKWVSLHIPHYSRIDISHLMAINGMSKLGLSMPGAGKKCFRTAEVSSNSLMIMEHSNMAWQFDWIDGVNYIGYKHKPVTVIKNALDNADTLHPIYVACVENARNYQFDNYTKHLEKIIND